MEYHVNIFVKQERNSEIYHTNIFCHVKHIAIMFLWDDIKTDSAKQSI